MVVSLDKRKQAVLEKAFELLEVSNRRDQLLLEFEELLSETKPRRSAKKAKSRSTGKARKRPAARAAQEENKADRILRVMSKTPRGGWRIKKIAEAIGESDNVQSVTATLGTMTKRGQIRRKDVGVYVRARG